MSEGKLYAPDINCSWLTEAQPSVIEVIKMFIEKRSKITKGSLWFWYCFSCKTRWPVHTSYAIQGVRKKSTVLKLLVLLFRTPSM